MHNKHKKVQQSSDVAIFKNTRFFLEKLFVLSLACLWWRKRPGRLPLGLLLGFATEARQVASRDCPPCCSTAPPPHTHTGNLQKGKGTVGTEANAGSGHQGLGPGSRVRHLRVQELDLGLHHFGSGKVGHLTEPRVTWQWPH